MGGAAAGLAQVNVRVDRHVKECADEALRLMGTSLPRLIRGVVDKVAQGGDQCEEVLAVIDPESSVAVASDSPFSSSWSSVDRLYQDLGIQLAQGQDTRDWDTVYSEAKDAHYQEKGLFL